MSALSSEMKKIRRFLRDPDGAVWTDGDLMAYWNESQYEIAQKAFVLERVESHYYPPRYDFSYMRDFEFEYTDGDRFLCLVQHQPSSQVICFPWESGYWFTASEAADDGHRYTHCWEAAYCSPAEPPRVPLHRKTDVVKFVAFDEVRIDPISERELAARNPYYKTQVGEVSNYYRTDIQSNQIVPYPMPSSFVFVDNLEDYEVFDDVSGQIYLEGDTEQYNYGTTTDWIDPVDALLLVYSFLPTDVVNWWDDVSDFPDWVLKYVAYATLERAFGADTDGFIPSLRDYWKMRKEAGINALKRMGRNKLADRDYRLGGYSHPRRSRGPSLPSGYPGI